MSLGQKIAVISLATVLSATTLAYAPQTANKITQEKPKKQETQIVGSYRPIMYRLEELIDPETGDVAKNPETGESILRVSREISKAYLLSLDHIYKIQLSQNDRIHFYRETEAWKVDEIHLPYQSELFKLILKELNGANFSPTNLKPGESIYLPDLDKNQVIILDKLTHDKIKSLGRLEDLNILIEDKKIYVQRENDRILIGEQRGELLTSDQVLEVIEQYKNPQEEKVK